MNLSSKDNKKKELNFEEAIAELEKIVARMEDGKLTLEDMMKDFEKASKLAEFCTSKLKEIEGKIEILINKNKDDAVWQNFNEYKKEQTSQENQLKF
ncbi:MAG TPA: exodeoxyribonuclease VII small subunit [Victivallales bacterium]|nr:exodeoxyribonuclease VII small subunit [Victivallales bacterium]HPO90012.1 exodeoxyribonuclease VII small subunit [Victivallales bacterium]HRR06070.1 exodeoxyribonuclease VII small subunit [Victivallales bacterium]HRR28946.1 exodeoxyribonuclease VII small subunit [Victivallales bacterium]HRU00351.1 exodeoxyribonuclease VII small subunit [Victivallales bacterium]